MSDAAPLFKGQGCNPDWIKRFLPVGESEASVRPLSPGRSDCCVSGVGRLAVRRTAKRDTAEDKGSGVIS